ncbi:MAG: glycosyltransferase family 39 protein [Chloroflexota bacterium]|nr:glycosyltransferase family 39 protein [Chloroflexota bacterium]
MEVVKQLLRRIGKWEYTWLCLLVLVTLAMHFSIIAQPGQLIFDEQHYIPDARSILQGHGTLILEHPSLGKLFIVLGMFLFGDNPLGWRFFSILFGAICIVLFYRICRKLEMPQRASFLATFMLALSNLSFLQASVAMLDVYSLAFMLGCFYLYLKGRYLLSGASIGLSALAKLNGALAYPTILLHWLLRRREHLRQFTGLTLLAPASFLLLMPLFDFIVFRQLVNPFARVRTMLTLSSSLTFASITHTALSRPWDWILHPETMFYWYDPHYIAAISFTIWALIIPVVCYMVFRALKGNSASLFGLSWFAGTYLVWIPISLITNRISFIYYFYPTVGAICIGLGLGLSQLLDVWESKKQAKLRWAAMLAVAGYLVCHIAVFVILSPVFARWVPLFYTISPP